MSINKIGVLGCGTMGSIILRSICDLSINIDIYVFDHNIKKISNIKNEYKKIKFKLDNSEINQCDVLIIAIKPQDFKKLSLTLKKDVLVISIMAGVSEKEIRKVLNIKKLVRAMPNIPVRIKKGVIGYFANKNVSSKEKEFAQKLFSEMGASFCVSSEKEIDMITAVSGSGPAYIFYMIDCFIKSANSIGLTSDIAKNIVIETFKGSLALIDKNTDFSTLIKNVASKGGTTEVALKEFNHSKIDKIWKKAVRKAYQRAKELSCLK